MAKIEREDIQTISQHSNWSKSGVSKTLLHHIYPDKTAWQRFLSLLFLGMGLSFCIAGIIFFFAFNWSQMHKFFKLGLVEALIVLVFLSIYFFRAKPFIKKSLLTVASVLVGVLYAVFGQVYQTGANAYDLFLVWTLFITVWAVISNFSLLWLVYIALINITIVLYAEQVSLTWDAMFLSILLFGVNTLFSILFIALPKLTRLKAYPTWFTNILILAATTIGTIGVSGGIMDKKDASFYVLLVFVFLFFCSGLWYGKITRNLFYLSVIPFGAIIVFCAFLLNISEDAGMLFVIGLFIIASISLLIKTLVNLQKKWTG
ncbi:DUF2157 domain-containing protein [Muricauda sp. TY007]|uniref:DUF2157 domain-containing protein n=1 Tax=Allomuricauda sp. TY007 TaxID=2683200 RepID=UPI0013C12260|nr:DUF2157 domain-containing protein [Muricauda sp. TY007]NDV14651.1 DUF2157 domain-containing protein [Muricauda sp. TY007]